MEFENQDPVSVKKFSDGDKDEAGVSDILLDLTRHQAQGDSIRLAELIQARLADASPYPNRGVKQAPFGVLKGAAMPAVVCEIGFINHRKEGVYITSQEGLEDIGLAIAKGILDYGELVHDTRHEKGIRKNESNR